MSFVEPATADALVTVLLVEDDHGDAVLVQESLREMGLPYDSVSWVRSLSDALAALPTVRPRCILLDLGLPDTVGFSGVHDLVGAVPDTAVIVLTGRQERDGSGALGAGAEDYLVKDAITPAILERSIRYSLERKRAQAAQQQLLELSLGAAEQARLERGLLPRPLLRSGRIECATYYRPGRGDAVLGGDFYDIVEIEDGTVRAVIGDVMGHGPDEAALGIHLRVAWRAMLLAGVPDELILPTLGRLLEAEEAEHPRFVTVCDVTIAPGAPMAVRLAGHPGPIVCDRSGARYLELTVGPPLGVRVPGTPEWPLSRADVPVGSSVVLYSDGLLEAYSSDPASDGLGIPELVDAVGRGAADGRPATSWIQTLVTGAPVASVDDTAALVLTRRA
ncbi:MAG TPA: fused response regulator/phosphatase [Jatrophihabitans sp.]|jgi:serine phosphatase RsbU (regulator of sigma subunit)|uniref:PP2C family protein-serine/threonine phosphatase n=1 Tax=Jatrophihabitans sp. TaxID=1932789 RepID=UPI002DFC9C2D|nr:fused response regulator/phosphatase [Jatrophihabitans sp.]